MKLIKITDEDKQTIRTSLLEQIEKELAGTLSGDKTLTLKYKIADLFKVSKLPKYLPPTLAFTADAWIKMTELVRQNSTEIGMHGTVELIPSTAGDVFVIRDILVYPQLVAGTTCESADDYPTWLYSLDDEVFNSIRFQAHSHVNMGVTPSAVDEQHRENMLTQISDYYIFVVINKRGDLHCTIYDKARGVIFEDKEIGLTIWLGSDEILSDWLEDSNGMLRARASAAPIKSFTQPPPYSAETLDDQFTDWRSRYGGGQEF